MKNQKFITIPLLALGLFAITFSSCKKSTTNTPTALTLSSLKSGSTDLNGSVTATGVDPSQPIVATFSTAVDASTATAANITMTNTTEDSSVALNITTSGSTITITSTNFGSGTQYELTFSSGLKATNGQSLTSTSRTFITAGAFAPAGATAYWNFDGNANDQSGNSLNPDYTNAVTYVAGRNATAGQAASFNGTSSLIEYPNASYLVNTASFTLSFWAYFDTVGHVDSLGNPKGFFVMGIGFYNGFEFEADAHLSTCKMSATYNNDTVLNSQDLWADCTGNLGFPGWTYSKDLSGSGGLKAILGEQWANIVCEYDESTKIGSIYINNVLIKQQNFNSYPPPTPFSDCQGLEFNTSSGAGTGFVFGFGEDRSNKVFGTNYPWGVITDPYANHFQGYLDDVRIYHKALTANEIGLMYNSGK